MPWVTMICPGWNACSCATASIAAISSAVQLEKIGTRARNDPCGMTALPSPPPLVERRYPCRMLLPPRLSDSAECARDGASSGRGGMPKMRSDRIRRRRSPRTGAGGVEWATARMVRKHAPALPWLRGVVFFAAIADGARGTAVLPDGGTPAASRSYAPPSACSPRRSACWRLVLVLAIPLAAGDFLVGVLFLLVGLVVRAVPRAERRAGVRRRRARVRRVAAQGRVGARPARRLPARRERGRRRGVRRGRRSSRRRASPSADRSSGVLATGGTNALVDAAPLRRRAGSARHSAGSARRVAKLNVDAVLKAARGSPRRARCSSFSRCCGAVAAALSGSLAEARGARVRSHRSPSRAASSLWRGRASLAVAALGGARPRGAAG